MGYSGYVDWHRLDRTSWWSRNRAGQHTYVYAFWLVDYGRSDTDHGVTLLKAEGAHPDWFLHAETADQVLAAYTRPSMSVSPNFRHVFGNNLAAKPLLGALLLGTADAVYRTVYEGKDSAFRCTFDDLTRAGKKLMRANNKLYERPAHLVTFVDNVTDENSGSRGPVD